MVVACLCLNAVASLPNVCTSITVDMGVELGLCKVPDILDAFFRWLRGATTVSLIGTVILSSRLTPNALPIPGWSHIFAWAMYKFVKRHPQWPELLESIRIILKTFSHSCLDKATRPAPHTHHPKPGFRNTLLKRSQN